MISNKICLENFKTSLTDLVNTHKKSNFQKIIKYIKNPLNILPRILYEFKKYKSEIDWNERSEKMGNSSVYGNLIDEEEQKKITDIHRKILLKCLDGKISKGSKVLDFGCGYGRFSDFFDVIFVFAVFGGFKKKKLLDIFNILKTKIKPKSKIVVVEVISEKNVEGEWSLRTEQYYKKLLSNFDISTKFYFLEDNKFKQIFFGKNFKKKELSS